MRLFPIIVLLYPLLAAVLPSKFDKETYLKACGYSVESHLLKPDKERELVYGVERKDKKYQNMWELFQKTHDYELARQYILEGEQDYYLWFLGRGPDSLLENNIYAFAIDYAQNMDEVVRYMLDYSTYESYENMAKIGRATLQYEEEIGDSLSFVAYYKVIKGTDDYEEAYRSAYKAYKLASNIFGSGSFEEYDALRLCATYSQLYDDHLTQYADSLIQYVKTRGMQYVGYTNDIYSDPLYLRYCAAIMYDFDPEYAKEIIDLMLPSIESDGSDKLTMNSLGEYMFTLLVESARIRYFLKDRTYKNYIERLVDKYIESLSPLNGNFDISEYLEPEFEFYPNLTAIMSHGYILPSAEQKYNLALFLKGTSSQITSTILNILYDKGERIITEYADSLRKNYLRYPLEDEIEKYSLALIAEDSYKTAIQRYDHYEKLLNDFIDDYGKEKIWDQCIVQWEDVEASLREDETAVEIIHIPDLILEESKYGAIVLNKHDAQPTYVELCSDTKLIEAVQGNLYKKNNHEIYDLIIAPLEKYIHGSTIFYSPSGILTTVNISAINDSAGNRISTKYHIRDCISSRSVCDKKPDFPSLTDIMLIGGLRYDDGYLDISTVSERNVARDIERDGFDYLIHSLSEVESISEIAHIHNIPNELLTAFEGTELRFKMLSGKRTPIIHIATHGFYYNSAKASDSVFLSSVPNYDDALARCGLVFSYGQDSWMNGLDSDNKNDGILIGKEIAKMNLTGTDLLVLSACNTALGDVSNEGVSGLQLAFKKAGVNKMLLTLRPVDDEATELFMTSFYTKLFNGETYRSAFDYAVDTLKNNERYSDPWYWASFILFE